MIQFCMDAVYGDYGVPVSRYIERQDLSPLEASVRTLWAQSPWIEHLESVTIEGNVAIADFVPDSLGSPVWGNVGTSAYGESFLVSFLETSRQFSAVEAVALRFGEDLWWPLEIGGAYKPLGYERDRLPLGPRPIDDLSALAALPVLAERLAESHGGEPWYTNLGAIEWHASGVLIRSDFTPDETTFVADIVETAEAILYEYGDRWCDVSVRVSSSNGTLYDRLDDQRSC